MGFCFPFWEKSLHFSLQREEKEREGALTSCQTVTMDDLWVYVGGER